MQEWPIRKPEPDAEQAMLPLALHEHVEMILASPPVRAFAERRAEQMLRFGHSNASDADKPIDYLVRQAQDRLTSYLERTGRNCPKAPPEQLDILVRKIVIAGALLLAAYDQLTHVPPSDGEPE